MTALHSLPGHSEQDGLAAVGNGALRHRRLAGTENQLLNAGVQAFQAPFLGCVREVDGGIGTYSSNCGDTRFEGAADPGEDQIVCML